MTCRVKGQGSNTPSQPPAEHVKTELTAKDHLVPEECRASLYLSPYDMPTVNQHPHRQPTPPCTVNQHPHHQPTPPPSTNTPTVNQHPHRQPTPPPSTNTPMVNQHPHRQPTPPLSLNLLHPTVTPELLSPPHPTSPHLIHHSTPPHPTPCRCSPHPPHPPLGCGVEPGPHTPLTAVVYALKVKYNSIINAYTVHNVTRLNQTESLYVWGDSC